MSSDEPRLVQMSPNDPRCAQMSSDEPRGAQMSPVEPRWIQMSPDESRRQHAYTFTDKGVDGKTQNKQMMLPKPIRTARRGQEELPGRQRDQRASCLHPPCRGDWL